ncbi:hypothetical protein CFAM422_009295 [Trichoderma lentiforme]|uniref:Uncharacterized protein n=1 Tax=Trichoderma lentiforme TaxID=1567552 RepID=A0A9P4X9Y0_9HYPO|nr:hypothetical protein CFAM422_009295 [Trichoderma lentiforme]
MASENFTTMPSEINWEEFLAPIAEFLNQTPDGSLPEVDFPNNFNDQTSGIVDGNELPEAVAPPTQEVEFDIDEYFDIDEFLAAAYDGGSIGEGQPEMANGQFQEDWSFQNGPFEPFEQMGFEQQDLVAAFNPAFMAPPATPFVTAPATPLVAAPVTPLVSAPVTPFDPAPATIPNPIPGTNSTNSTNISNIPPTDGSGRPHICPDPKCGASTTLLMTVYYLGTLGDDVEMTDYDDSSESSSSSDDEHGSTASDDTETGRLASGPSANSESDSNLGDSGYGNSSEVGESGDEESGEGETTTESESETEPGPQPSGDSGYIHQAERIMPKLSQEFRYKNQQKRRSGE